MATAIRCYSCRTFFDTKLLGCPECDAPRRGRNSYLYTAKLNSHLFAAAEKADADRKTEAMLRQGHVNPSKNMRRAVSKFVDAL